MTSIALITIGTFIMALAGVIRSDESKKIIFRKNFLFIFAGVAFIGIGTFLNATEQAKVENDLIIELKKNSKLNEKIAQISEKSLATITGGKSYIVVMPTFMSKDREYVSLIVTSYGDYPLYDVKIDITDVDLSSEIENTFSLEEKNSKPGLVVSEIMKATYNYTVGNKTQGQAKLIPYKFKLNHNGLNKRRFSINIFARNGIFNEQLRMKKIGNDWVSAYKVTTSPPNNAEKKILFTRVDEKYTNVESDW